MLVRITSGDAVFRRRQASSAMLDVQSDGIVGTGNQTGVASKLDELPSSSSFALTSILAITA